ncbi:MAG: hypothetical protein ACOC2F_05565 [Bacteroidota bacterium]
MDSERSYYDLKEDLREIEFLLRNPEITEEEINYLLDRRQGIKSRLTLKSVKTDL